MKQTLLAAGLLAACIPTAQAVDLNKDAMKAMQQEGHKIVANSQGGRAYKTANGLCLDVSGNALVVKKCNAKTNNQKWRVDGQGRLVAHSGQCIDQAQLKKCGKAKSQKWQHDGKKRLANNTKQCLQTQSNPAKAGNKVDAVSCGGGKNQIWK